MELGFINKNIVLIGDFKPVSFDKLSFIKSGFLAEEDFLDSSIFLPDLTIIDTPSFIIEINSDRFSLNFKLVDIKIDFEKFKSLLSNSKIIAFGFNFKRAVFLNQLSDTKKFFYFEKNVLNNFFDSDNTAYGYYISKDYEDSRLKLDIKPVQLQKVNENVVLNALDFSFNFHFNNSNFYEKFAAFETYENLTLEIISNYGT